MGLGFESQPDHFYRCQIIDIQLFDIYSFVKIPYIFTYLVFAPLPDNMAAVNDLSEDMRKEIDNIYQAIAELSIRPVASEKPRKKIGFKTNSDE